MTTTVTTMQTAHDATLFEEDKVRSIDPNKSYVAVIQLGACKRWRQYPGGKWTLDKDQPGDGSSAKKYTHVPSIHETDPITGATLLGLISAHNKWVAHNKVREIDGQMNRQILVLSFRESQKQATDVPPISLTTPEGIKNLIESIVAGTMEAMKKDNNQNRRGN